MDYEIKLRLSGLEIFFKKHLKKLVIKKRIYTFAPAQRDKRYKEEEYVPRHIELTAVLKRDFKNKQKESKRVERFEKDQQIRLKNSQAKLDAQYTMKSLILAQDERQRQA